MQANLTGLASGFAFVRRLRKGFHSCKTEHLNHPLDTKLYEATAKKKIIITMLRVRCAKVTQVTTNPFYYCFRITILS